MDGQIAVGWFRQFIFHDSSVAASAEVWLVTDVEGGVDTGCRARRFPCIRARKPWPSIRAGRVQLGQLQRHQQDDFVFVAIGGDVGGRQFFRERPLDFAGGDAGGRCHSILVASRRRRDFSSRCASPAPFSDPRRPDGVAGAGGVGGQNQPHLGVGGCAAMAARQIQAARMVPMRRTRIRCHI